MADICFEGVWKTYPGARTPAVRDVSLALRDGQLMVLLGPSGCGKTTLLRLLAGLEHPDAGRIVIGGRDVTDVPPRKRGIGMVFQSYALFPHMTAFDNVAFGLRMQRCPAPEVRTRVEQAAALLQLEPYLGRYPAQLSGGQRQRVAVARAIVMRPAVLLMDEPLSNLDALLRLQFRAELKKLVAEVEATTLYVTHDQVEALSLGDRIAVMRDGQILQVAEPMVVYDRPATAFVGSFIGSPPMNFLRGVARRENGQIHVELGEQALVVAAPEPATDDLVDPAGVLVGIRAENIQATTVPPSSGAPALRAATVVVEPLGSHLLLTTTVGDQTIKVTTQTSFPAQPGATIWLQPHPGKLRWLRASDGTAIAER